MGDMPLTVEIMTTGNPPPEGSPVIVQLRDTTVQDAAATIVSEMRTNVAGGGGSLATVTFDAARPGLTVWVHVDVDRDGRVSKGDYITKQSFAARAEGGPLRVNVSAV